MSNLNCNYVRWSKIEKERNDKVIKEIEISLINKFQLTLKILSKFIVNLSNYKTDFLYYFI